MDRRRHRRDGRPERADLPHRIPRRLRPQQRETPVRPRPGTVPALESRARRPQSLGTAARTRITPRKTATATASPQTQSRRPLACPLTGLPNTYILATAADDRIIPRNPCRIDNTGKEDSPHRAIVPLSVAFAIPDPLPPRSRMRV